MIRSTAVNRLVLGAGLLFLACAAAILAGYLLNPADVRFPIGPIAFFTILGGWCAAGAIANLRKPAAPAAPPLKTAVLVKWNIAVLLASTAGSVLYLAIGGGPDPTPLQRTIGMVMVWSIFAVPLVLCAYAVERFVSRKA